MILSVLFYYFFASVLFFLGQQEWDASRNVLTGCHKTQWTLYTYILLAFFILMCALRYRTGVDCESYVDIMKHGYTFDRERGEYLFDWLCAFSRSIGESRYFYLGVLAALQIIPFYYAFKTRKYLYAYLGLLLIVGPYYLMWMNGIRQTISACLFVLVSVLLIDKKKRIIPAILLFVATLFHHSAYILFIFLFLPIDKDFFKNRSINVAVLILCAIVGQTPFMYEKINEYVDFLGILGSEYNFYSDYLTRIDVIQARGESMTFGPRRIIQFVLSLEMIWFTPKMKEYYKNDKFFIFTFNLFLINAWFGDFLLSNVSHAFRRPFLYFQPFGLIAFSYMLYYFKNGLNNKGRNLYYIGTILLSCLYIAVQCYSEANLVNETSLFKFYFLHAAEF